MKIESNNPLTKSKDIIEDNIIKLKELFPEIVTDGKIDFKNLHELRVLCGVNPVLKKNIKRIIVSYNQNKKALP